MTLVPPFNDPYIICGQGTVGLEITAQCAERDITPDAVLAPASGGGLISGIALAVKSRLPDCSVYCAEPHGYDDIDQRSEEHTSELQSLMRISYAVFCLTKKTTKLSQPRHLQHENTLKHHYPNCEPYTHT